MARSEGQVPTVVDPRADWHSADVPAEQRKRGQRKSPARRKLGAEGFVEKLMWAMTIVMRSPNRAYAVGDMLRQRPYWTERQAMSWIRAVHRWFAMEAAKTGTRGVESVRAEMVSNLKQKIEAAEAKGQFMAVSSMMKTLADVLGVSAKVVPGAVNVQNTVIDARSVTFAQSADEHLAMVDQARQMRLAARDGARGARGRRLGDGAGVALLKEGGHGSDDTGAETRGGGARERGEGEEQDLATILGQYAEGGGYLGDDGDGLHGRPERDAPGTVQGSEGGGPGVDDQ